MIRMRMMMMVMVTATTTNDNDNSNMISKKYKPSPTPSPSLKSSSLASLLISLSDYERIFHQRNVYPSQRKTHTDTDNGKLLCSWTSKQVSRLADPEWESYILIQK